MNFDDIRFYVSRFWRRLPLLLACVVLVGAAAIFAALRMPPVYQADAQLLLEGEKIPDELASSTVDTSANVHLELIRQRVLSRAALLDMSHRLAVFGDRRPNPDTIIKNLRDRITYSVSNNRERRKGPAVTTLTLSFRDSNAAISAAVVNELASMVMNEDVRMRTDSARETLAFFEREVFRLRSEIEQSNDALLSFQQQHPSVLHGGTQFRQERLKIVEEELFDLDSEESELLAERDRLTRVHDVAKRREAEARGLAPDFESRQIDALRQTLTNLPNGDPGAAEIESRIEGLVRIVERRDADESAPQVRTAYHDRMAMIDARLGEIEARRADLTSDFETTRLELAAVPELSLEFAALERDHDTLRAQLTDALRARAVAETGDTIEALSKGKRVTIVEQAVVPRETSGPDQLRRALLGIGAGIGLGLALIMWLEFRLDFLRRPVDLERRLGIQAIATLPVLNRPRIPIWRRIFRRRQPA
ncbi:MAG: Wzz/FepE/Etk N-terminal domain-containing protein [Pseudomonadota bacterium]